MYRRAKSIPSSRASWSLVRLLAFSVISFVVFYLLSRVSGYIFLDFSGLRLGGAIDRSMIVLFSVYGYFFVWYALLLYMLGFVFGVLVRFCKR